MPNMNQIPEEIQDKFARLVAQFCIDWKVEHDAVVMFMMQIIETYEEYQKGEMR